MFDLFGHGSPGSPVANKKYKYHPPVKEWVGLDKYDAVLPLPDMMDEITARLTASPDVQPSAFKFGGAGRVVLPTVGGSIRSITPGRRSIATGTFISAKMRSSVKYEEVHEHRFLQFCEVDTGVVSYLTQPFRLEFPIQGEVNTWIVDVVRQLINGHIEVVEVKASLQALHDQAYVRKLAHARHFCASLGWSFRLVEGVDLLPKNVFNRNVSDNYIVRHIVP